MEDESTVAGQGGRFYKSRKSRPCDACRRRKVACDMPNGPPCHRCASRGFSCTFDHGPGERKRRLPAADASPHPTMMGWGYLDASLAGPSTPLADPGNSLLQDIPMDYFTEAVPHDRDVASSSPVSHIIQGSSPPGANDACTSLELVPDAFSFYIGPTGAADAHLLDREKFDARQTARPRIRGLRYRRVEQASWQEAGAGHPSTIFGITDRSLLAGAEPRIDADAIDSAWTELWQLIDLDTAWRLVKLYGRFVDPYFPIMATQQLPQSPDELSNVPLALLASICAAALPFVVYDEGLYDLLLHPPSSARLYRICWLDIQHHLHTPSLATLQACLLLQQRLPTNAYLSDTAFAWSLMSTAVAVAQTIGLHREPAGWSAVPEWECKLRRRLWWALWTMERWVALVRGMPSHVNDDEFDLAELEPDDIVDTLSSSPHTRTHFHQLVRLTFILADIQRTYYTVRATARTSNNLQLSLDSARIPRAQLKDWLDNLPTSLHFLGPEALAAGDRSRQDLDGTSSIHLSYIVTHMTLFRALLRPLDRLGEMAEAWSIGTADALYDGVRAVIRGSLLCVRNLVDWLEHLRDVHWNAFWHSWSRPNFAIAGSFMVHLLHVTSAAARLDLAFQEDDAELRALVRRWRMAIRVAANGAAGV